MPNPFSPLTEEELDELDNFLLYGVDSDESMTLDMLDGYLHAIAIGPITLFPKQWLPKIWGEKTAMVPAMESMDQLNRVLELVMRHFNSIIASLEQEPKEIYPHWDVRQFEGREYDDAESWAYGFTEGVGLCREQWDSLLRTPQGQSWYRPIALLGEDDYSEEQEELTRTPAQRAKLSLEIPEAVVAMHGHWLPYRQALHERELAKTLQPKVGRNETCPCGSGKKFKKCCGAGGVLH